MSLLKPATLLKGTFLHGCFSSFLNCTNGTKFRTVSSIFKGRFCKKKTQRLKLTKSLKKVYHRCLTGSQYPAGKYLFKVNNRNSRIICEICSKLTIKTITKELILVKFSQIQFKKYYNWIKTYNNIYMNL